MAFQIMPLWVTMKVICLLPAISSFFEQLCSS